MFVGSIGKTYLRVRILPKKIVISFDVNGCTGQTSAMTKIILYDDVQSKSL